jgi:uncharacterized protein YmfQ (DUF2313 family)
VAELLVAVSLVATFAGGFGFGRISGARRQAREIVTWARRIAKRWMPRNRGESLEDYARRVDSEVCSLAGAELVQRAEARRG